MELNFLTQQARLGIAAAGSLAESFGDRECGPEFLLLALLHLDGVAGIGQSRETLSNAEELAKAVESAIRSRLLQTPAGQPEAAQDVARRNGDSAVVRLVRSPSGGRLLAVDALK